MGGVDLTGIYRRCSFKRSFVIQPVKLVYVVYLYI